MGHGIALLYLTVCLLYAPEDHCLHSIRLLGNSMHIVAKLNVWLLLCGLKTDVAFNSLLLQKQLHVEGLRSLQ